MRSASLVLATLLIFGVSPASSGSPGAAQNRHLLARTVLASQPNFVATLYVHLADGDKMVMQIAKKGDLYRLDYPSEYVTQFLSEAGWVWSYDSELQTAMALGMGPSLSAAFAPWTMFRQLLSMPEVRIDAVGSARDRSGRPTKIALYGASSQKPEMIFIVSGSNGLVTRIEIPNRPKEAAGDGWDLVPDIKYYELKDIKYQVPTHLFPASLPEQPREGN